MRGNREPNDRQEERRRKHLILYILDIPYLFIYWVIYKVVGTLFALPLFLIFSWTQVRLNRFKISEPSFRE